MLKSVPDSLLLKRNNGPAGMKCNIPRLKAIHTHTNKHTLSFTYTLIHTNTHGGTRLHISAKPITKNKTKKTTKLFPFIPGFQALQLARKAH